MSLWIPPQSPFAYAAKGWAPGKGRPSIPLKLRAKDAVFATLFGTSSASDFALHPQRYTTGQERGGDIFVSQANEAIRVSAVDQLIPPYTIIHRVFLNEYIESSWARYLYDQTDRYIFNYDGHVDGTGIYDGTSWHFFDPAPVDPSNIERWHTFVWVIKTGSAFLYRSGVQIGNEQFFTPKSIFGDKATFLGRYEPQARQFCLGSHEGIVVLPRALSPAEARAVSLDFYGQLFEPANQSPYLLEVVSAPPAVNVDPVTEALVITTPQVDVQVGLDIAVNPVTEALEIATPQVTVEYLPFTNIDVLTEALVIATPQVEVAVFEDTVVNPIKESLVILTPQVDVFIGDDIDIDPATVALIIATAGVQVQTPVEFLIATEAAPLEYTVSLGGDVQMTSNPDAAGVLAWRNEHGGLVELDPFPAVISSQPADQGVTAPNPASFSVTATGAASYQWYVDDVPQIGATLSTFIINPTFVGTYAVRCMAINSSGIGITSKDAVLTVI